MPRSPRKRRPPTRQPPPPPVFEWKDHPVIVAAGSAAATTALCIAIFTQLVVPTQTAKLEIELLKMKESRDEAVRVRNSFEQLARKQSKRSEVIAKEVQSLKSQELSLRQEIAELKERNMFAAGSPYPAGLAQIQIGMPATRIHEVYPAKTIRVDEEDGGIIAVRLSDSPFESVSYYLRDANKRVGHIAFDLPPSYDSKFSEDFLYSKLTEAFGAPIESRGTKTKKHKWRVDANHSIYTWNETGFVLMKGKSEPLFWALL